jgi:hypothetical protein
VDAGQVVSGYPAIDNRAWLKASAVFHRLPELLRRLRDLEGRIRELEGGGDPAARETRGDGGDSAE